MAVSVDNRPTRLRSFLAAVVTVLILVPAGYLFYRVWETNDDKRDTAKLEQLGVDYLTNLAPLVGALAEAQAAAMQGASGAPASLSAAVARVAAADQRLGGALGTRERWTGLRDKIGQLSGVAGNPLNVYQAHMEVGDLTLALYDEVRNNSTLIRDPDNDLSHLQQAVAVDLPTAVVQVTRMGVLSLMLANVRGSAKDKATQQAILGPQLGAAVQFVNSSVNNLTDDLQAAVDDTNSATLSGDLVTGLDSFRRGVESLTRGANPGGAPNAATMATAQTELQTSANGLNGLLLREMNGLLKDRLDNLDTQRFEALLAAGVAVLLTLISLVLWLTGRRRRRRSPLSGDSMRDMPVRQGGHEPGYANFTDPAPLYGEVNPTRRERSGALR
jgi:hypothetical protein